MIPCPQPRKGCFDLNLDAVQHTVRAALPEMLKQLHAVRRHADDGNDDRMAP